MEEINMQKLQMLTQLFGQKVFYKNCYDEIVQYLNHAGVSYMSGTKRIVIQHPNNPAKVIKIGFKKAGVDDNLNDVMTSNYINTLNNGDPILKSNIVLSTPFQVGSTFMIICDKIEIAREFKPFLEYVKSQSGNVNLRKAMLKYISMNPDLLSQYNSLRLAIRAARVLNADINILSEPANYGFRMNGNRIMLMLCDIGSCTPTYRSTMPKCKLCQNDLHPIIKKLEIGAMMERAIGTDDISRQRDMYSCSSPGCANNIDKVDVNATIYTASTADDILRDQVFENYIDLVDTEVFNNYVQDMADDIRRNAIHIVGSYSPATPVQNINQYAESLRAEFPTAYDKVVQMTVQGKHLMTIMYDNWYHQYMANRKAEIGLKLKAFFMTNRASFASNFMTFEVFRQILVVRYQQALGNQQSPQVFFTENNLGEAVADAYLAFIYNGMKDLANVNLGDPGVVYQVFEQRRLPVTQETINAIVYAYKNLN